MVDKLIQGIRKGFEKFTEHRYRNAQIKLADFAMCAFAMFHLKDPSLNHYRLNYEERESNLKRIYKIEHLYSDSAFREAIDGIEPGEILDCFKIPLQELQDAGVLRDYQVLGGYQCILFDATQHYCSSKVPCEHCLTKEHKNKKGEVTKTTYHHQALAAVIAHHGNKEVFPVACEAIVRQDGETKNDCEINAAKRLLPTVGQMLPDQSGELLGVFDGLYPNGPMIRLLESVEMRYVIGIQEGYVMVQVESLRAKNGLQTQKWTGPDGEKCEAHWVNNLILNGTHQDIRTNYFEYKEFDKDGTLAYSNSWITDIEITQSNLEELIKIGRSRWMIENETFNTLKNQGYNLKHNYGHGEKFLATNFMLFTFLAFLIDQIAQHMDDAFHRAVKYCKTKKKLWEKVRQVFDLLPCMSMNVIYRFIAREIKIDFPLLE